MNKVKIAKLSALVLPFAIAPAMLVTLDSCSTHQSSPDPVETNIINGTHQHVIQEPSGYRNVAFSCFGSNGVYVTSRSSTTELSSSVFVVVNDPQCG